MNGSESANDIRRWLRILAENLSKPVALDGFKFLKVEITLSIRICENLNCAREDRYTGPRGFFRAAKTRREAERRENLWLPWT